MESIMLEGTTSADPRKLRDIPLASTGAGKEWVIKALHPADHEVQGTQLTVGTALRSVPFEYTGYVDVQPPATQIGTDTTWDCVLDVFQHPLTPVVIIAGNAGLSATTTSGWFTPGLSDAGVAQLEEAAITALNRGFAKSCEK